MILDKNILPYLLFNCYMVEYRKDYILHKKKGDGYEFIDCRFQRDQEI